MKILVQVGSLGSSVIDHLISPLAKVNNLNNVLLICRYPGPVIPGVEYHCPPGLLAKSALVSVVYEYLSLIFLSLFRRPTHLAGYLLFPHGLMATIVAKLTRRPIIVSLIAGPVELYAAGSPLGVDYERPLPRYGRLLLKVLKHSDAIITTGSCTKSFLVKHNLQQSRIYPLINPPNKLRFYPLDIPRVYDILSVGRLAPVKHVEVIVRAISRVKERYPGIKACIVGDGPCKPELTRLVDELGVKDNIDFVGFKENMLHYYNSSRIFVHASEREGFPNVVLEAMMCGLPCVISNCGDVVDIAKDGFNSLVVPKFTDYEAFARAITRLLKDEKLYNELSGNAIKTAGSVSAEDVTRKWEIILDNLL